MTRQILPILALFTSTFFLLTGGGVQWIVLPIRAQMEAFSTDAIGIIGFGWATGFTAGCLIVPRIVRRVGHVRAFSSLLALAAIAILVTAMAVNPVAWFAMRVIGGLCFSGSYMIIESWLNERVGNEQRGALFAIYAMITMAGVMTGQYVILFVDPGSQAAFMVAGILFALAILPTALSTAQSPQALTEVRLNIVELYRNSPVALIGIFLAGSIAGSWQSFAPVFGTMSGLSNVNIANVMAIVMVGSILFQYPMGRISDRMDRRIVMVAVGLAGTLVCGFAAVHPIDGDNPGWLFFGLMMLAGGFIYPIYTILVAHANDHADPADYVHVSASMYLIYGMGSMAGPIITARTTAIFGAGGMFMTIAVMNAMIAGYAAWRMTRRRRVKPDETTSVQPIAPLPGQTPQTPQTFELMPSPDPDVADVPPTENYG